MNINIINSIITNINKLEERKVIEDIYIAFISKIYDYGNSYENISNRKDPSVEMVYSCTAKSKLEAYQKIIVNNLELHLKYITYSCDCIHNFSKKDEMINLLDDVILKYKLKYKLDFDQTNAFTIIESLLHQYHDNDTSKCKYINFDYDKDIGKILDTVKLASLEDFVEFEEYINRFYYYRFSLTKLSNSLVNVDLDRLHFTRDIKINDEREDES